MLRTWAVQTLMTPPWQNTATRFPGWLSTISSSAATTVAWKPAISTPWLPWAMASQAS